MKTTKQQYTHTHAHRRRGIEKKTRNKINVNKQIQRIGARLFDDN